LPSANDCPECKGRSEEYCLSKRQCIDHQDQRPISRDRHEEKLIPVHDRLGHRFGVHDQLENMANDRVLHEESLNHEIEHQHNY
jgi:hypothetical protein